MGNKPTVQVWDILVRTFHWSLVLFFIIAYASSEESEDIHEFAGYVVLGLIVVRLLWGFVGSEYARFSNFIYSPQQVIQYIRDLFAGQPKHYLGHNPLGGWMVVALLTLLFVVTLSGVKLELLEESSEDSRQAVVSMADAPVAAVGAVGDGDTGDHEDSNSESGEEFWEEVHEAATNIMLVLIALHIAGVALSSRLHKESLVKAMITGKKEQ